MASTTATATTYDLPNYTGELFLLGQATTPFLNLIGGITGGNGVKINSDEYSMSQGYELNAAAQPAISESASTTAPSSTVFEREQESNVVQIFQRSVKVTYSKQGNANAIEGVNVLGVAQPVRNELDFQIEANLKQIAKDANYTFLHGAYNKATKDTEINKTRGVITGITTNVVTNTTQAKLTKDMLQELLRNSANDGFDFNNAVLLVDAYSKQLITEIYAYAPEDRNIGGANIKQIETDFGNVMVVFEPAMKGTDSSTLALLDMNKIKPVFKEIPGKGLLFYEDLAKTGAAENGQLYGQMGIDYGSERFHAKITNLLSE